MFNEKLPDGALSNPTGGVPEPDVTIKVRDDKVEGFELIDVQEEEGDAVFSYRVEIMTSHKGIVTENVEGINLGPSAAAAQALGRVLRADQVRVDRPEGVAIRYGVLSCTETGRLALK
jgi:hypothetical protein